MEALQGYSDDEDADERPTGIVKGCRVVPIEKPPIVPIPPPRSGPIEVHPAEATRGASLHPPLGNVHQQVPHVVHQPGTSQVDERGWAAGPSGYHQQDWAPQRLGNLSARHGMRPPRHMEAMPAYSDGMGDPPHPTAVVKGGVVPVEPPIVPVVPPMQHPESSSGPRHPADASRGRAQVKPSLVSVRPQQVPHVVPQPGVTPPDYGQGGWGAGPSAYSPQQWAPQGPADGGMSWDGYWQVAPGNDWQDSLPPRPAPTAPAYPIYEAPMQQMPLPPPPKEEAPEPERKSTRSSQQEVPQQDLQVKDVPKDAVEGLNSSVVGLDQRLRMLSEKAVETGVSFQAGFCIDGQSGLILTTRKETSQQIHNVVRALGRSKELSSCFSVEGMCVSDTQVTMNAGMYLKDVGFTVWGDAVKFCFMGSRPSDTITRVVQNETYLLPASFLYGSDRSDLRYTMEAVGHGAVGHVMRLAVVNTQLRAEHEAIVEPTKANATKILTLVEEAEQREKAEAAKTNAEQSSGNRKRKRPTNERPPLNVNLLPGVHSAFSVFVSSLRPLLPVEGAPHIDDVELCRLPGTDELFVVGRATTVLERQMDLSHLVAMSHEKIARLKQQPAPT